MIIYGCLVVIMIVASWIEQRADDAEARVERQARWPANIALAVVNGGIAATLPVSTVAMAHFADDRGFGLMNIVSVPLAVSGIVTILVMTFVQYGLHRIMHSVPLLWRLHRIHHADSQTDGTTAFRHHPVETVLVSVLSSTVVLLLGAPPAIVFVLALLDASFAILAHGSTTLPERIETRVNRLFITPTLHRVHHSDWHRETDTNYGGVLSIWDRAFGTFLARPLRDTDKFRIGLRGIGREDAASLDYLLTLPLSKPPRGGP